MALVWFVVVCLALYIWGRKTNNADVISVLVVVA